MTTQVILVSHALTQWNVEGRIQGHTDVPLNHQGRRMAELLAGRLARETIHAVFTSDLKRAIQTGEPTANQKSLPLIQDCQLREGRIITQERSSVYPTLPFSRQVETRDDLSKRMTAALARIARSHDNQTVLVVSHAGSLDIFINGLLEKQELRPDAGSDKKSCQSPGQMPGKPSLTYQGIRMALNWLRFDSGLWHCIHLNEDDFLKE